MIRQYNITLSSPDKTGTGFLPSALAYRLYAWLLEQLPPDYAVCLHDGETPSVSQSISQETWTVNVFKEGIAEYFDRILKKHTQIDLHTAQYSVLDCTVDTIPNGTELLRYGSENRANKHEWTFISPTAFRQAGRYTIFPHEALLLQSLTTRWNALFPTLLLDDPDSMEALDRGIHIVDYKLRTVRYPLKHTTIPSFVGTVITEAQLPMVLSELWCSLTAFAPYSGIGIKTTLGMGGVRCRPLV